MKSAYSAPQARHWVARAILRAGRRGDEAMGEELMLTPETRGVNIIDAWQVMATPGKDLGPLAASWLTMRHWLMEEGPSSTATQDDE
jgi:hypothetical protein